MYKRKVLEIKEIFIKLLEKRQINIEKIILFGSYAKSSFNKYFYNNIKPKLA
jgi:predicted nucleotidyltransferase